MKITPPNPLINSHQNYKEKIIKKRPNLELDEEATEGNTLLRFHGTTLSCKLSEKLSHCGEGSCVVCSISLGGFKISFSGKGPLSSKGFGQRFGDGLYFTSCSSKANDYGANTEKYLGVGIRSVLICQVVAGIKIKK